MAAVIRNQPGKRGPQRQDTQAVGGCPVHNPEQVSLSTPEERLLVSLAGSEDTGSRNSAPVSGWKVGVGVGCQQSGGQSGGLGRGYEGGSKCDQLSLVCPRLRGFLGFGTFKVKTWMVCINSG